MFVCFRVFLGTMIKSDNYSKIIDQMLVVEQQVLPKLAIEASKALVNLSNISNQKMILFMLRNKFSFKK